MFVQVPFEFPEDWRTASPVWSPWCEYRIFIVREHQARYVLNRCRGAANGIERPPIGPEVLRIRQKHPVGCQRSEPAVRARHPAVKCKPALIVDFIENRFAHELRDRGTLLGSQMLIKNVAIRLDWIEVFNESTVSAIGAAQVLAPGVQAERQNMREQTTVNFGVEQVLCVFPNVLNFRPIAGTQPRKVPKMSIIVLESFLPNPVWRHRSSKARRNAATLSASTLIYGISKLIILGKTFVEQQFLYSWLTTSDFACSSA